MKNAILPLLFALAILPAAAAAQQKDATGCTDHPLFTRMPTYWIHHCSTKQFDAKTMAVGDGKTTIEGRAWEGVYYPQATAKDKPSEIQILRNFENAVSKLGGTVVASPKSRRTFKIAKDGSELWVDLWADFTGKYGLVVVEKAAMNQDVEANAEVFSNDLKATGHAAVYGIYFDTGKSDLKPESAAAIKEIAALLTADAKLKVFVVGHTDNVGTLESNMRLSQDRAEAVVQALVRTHGIATARLKSFGSGPYSPVASNDAESGRAKNRRVELVKQ